MLVKAFSLLDVLDRPAAALPLRDLALAAGMPRPTAHRILAALAKLGYVRKDTGGVYRLSRRPPGRAHLDAPRLTSAAQPVIQRLNAATNETTNLAVLRGDRVVYLLTIESPHALRRVVRPGETDPFHCTALGRAIASQLPRHELEELLARLPPSVRPTALRKILDDAADRGFSFEQDETDIGVTCVGVPVTVDGQCVAAVSISAPTARVTAKVRHRWVTMLQQAAKDLSRSLANSES